MWKIHLFSKNIPSNDEMKRINVFLQNEHLDAINPLKNLYYHLVLSDSFRCVYSKKSSIFFSISSENHSSSVAKIVAGTVAQIPQCNSPSMHLKPNHGINVTLFKKFLALFMYFVHVKYAIIGKRSLHLISLETTLR